MTRAQLLTEIADNLPTNGQEEISASDLRAVLNALVGAAANLTDDKALFGLSEFNAANGYASGQVVVYQGVLYQANTAISPGPWNAASWTALAFAGDQPDLPDWENATTYDEDETVAFDSRLFRSLQDSNQGNTPGSSPTWWEEIAPAAQTQIPNWQPAFYKPGTVVARPDAVYRNTSTDDFYDSQDFATELGNWRSVVLGSNAIVYQPGRPADLQPAGVYNSWTAVSEWVADQRRPVTVYIDTTYSEGEAVIDSEFNPAVPVTIEGLIYTAGLDPVFQTPLPRLVVRGSGQIQATNLTLKTLILRNRRTDAPGYLVSSFGLLQTHTVFIQPEQNTEPVIEVASGAHLASRFHSSQFAGNGLGTPYDSYAYAVNALGQFDGEMAGESVVNNRFITGDGSYSIEYGAACVLQPDRFADFSGTANESLADHASLIGIDPSALSFNVDTVQLALEQLDSRQLKAGTATLDATGQAVVNMPGLQLNDLLIATPADRLTGVLQVTNRHTAPTPNFLLDSGNAADHNKKVAYLILRPQA